MSEQHSPTVELAKQLISRHSVTPDDAGCQLIMAEHLLALGFEIESLVYGDVENLWARLGHSGPLFVFAGHTDVVPTGPTDQWRHHPFHPTIENGLLYGRGAADMKGSLAAMMTATERFLEKHDVIHGSIAYLITSDEEGPAVNGTVKVVEALEARNEKIDWCLVGEPSSTNRVGDVIKNGRRGSLGARLKVIGRQGHVAYPHLAENPVHSASMALNVLCHEHWDEGNDFFPPTTFQISNIHAGTGADNVIPGELDIMFNFRYSTETSADKLKQRVEKILNEHNLTYELEWRHSGLPFLTEPGDLVNAAVEAVNDVAGYNAELSTAGGTSDGRFIAPTGAQVLELGPLNATIHQVNEHVACDDLDKLSLMYEKILEKLLLNN